MNLTRPYRALVVIDRNVETLPLVEAGYLPEPLRVKIKWGKVGGKRRLCWFTEDKHGEEANQGPVASPSEEMPNAILTVFNPRIRSQARKAEAITKEFMTPLPSPA
jgi:hypothetical protein